jgi:alkanesulfonate monooxygenase SsuD/methylene tetrahydromethanopterin reductase-like flavin-dependent oxidoreductase (luciferase family)
VLPERGKPLRKLGFLTIGRFDEADPGPGHEKSLSMIERAETLGFDSIWLRCRHLQPGISSPSRSWLPLLSAPAASNWARR